MNIGAFFTVTAGDFRDRVRRPAYLITLVAAIGLGYLAAPESGSKWAVMQIGDYRGAYNSAYLGTVTALASTLWFSLGGFFVVRNGIGRDRSTGVGQLLASTPIRTTGYLLTKFLSNFLVLTSMVGVLAATAVVMQLVRGESSAIDPVALLLPFLVFSIPVMALTAAAALLFELIPLLQKGFGNIVWFFLWLGLATGGQGAGAPLEGIGVHRVLGSFARAMESQNIADINGNFSLGLTYLESPLRTFVWDGYLPDAAFIGTRLGVIGVALAMVVVPALWCGRFDTARFRWSLPLPLPRTARRASEPMEEGAPSIRTSVDVGAAGTMDGPMPPRAGVPRGIRFPRLVLGELRILWQGLPWWWWAGTATLTFFAFLAPAHAIGRVVLPVCWFWPILVWSRLGCQRYEHNVDALLGAYPAATARVVAEWCAGVGVAVVTGFAGLVQLIRGDDWTGVWTFAAGASFVPALALLLGSLSRSHRLFQGVYLPLWYLTVNGLPVVDYMGANRVDGVLAGPPPVVIASAALTMVAGVLVVDGLRRNLVRTRTVRPRTVHASHY